MLELTEFDLNFDVPYTFLTKFHLNYKPFAEEIYKRKYPNISPGCELEFSNIWEILMNTTTRIINDTFYFPF